MSLLHGVAVTAFVLAASALIMLVLIQKGRGVGSLFGGTGGGVIGPAGLPTFMFWATSAAFGVFVVLAALLNRLAA